MPLPVIANTYRCAVTFTSPSFAVTNVLHLEKATSDEAEIAAAFDAACDVGNIFFEISGGFDPGVLEVTKLDGSSAGQTFETPNALPTKAGEYLPSSAAIISLHSATRGPRGRGRLYIGPLVEGAVQNGRLLHDDQESLTGNATAFLASLEGDGVTWVVASYVHSEAYPVTSVVVRTGLGTQRRRQAHFL